MSIKLPESSPFWLICFKVGRLVESVAIVATQGADTFLVIYTLRHLKGSKASVIHTL